MKRLRPFVLSHIQIIVIFCCLLLLDTSVVDAKIVFCIGNDIYVMDDNGTNRNKRRLTQNTETRDHHPRWSPDGERIAFSRKMDRNQTSSELFIMNADGTNVQRLTDNNFIDGSPSWSPDGKRITFDSTRSGRWDVHVLDLATLHVTQLTSIEDGGTGAVAPDWSPDGTQIVYEQFTVVGARHIYVMSANGENQRPLLQNPNPDAELFAPRWSADGQRILFDDCKGELNNGRLVHRCILTVAAIRRQAQQIQGIYDRLGNNLLVSTACWMHNDKELLFDVIRFDNPKPNYDIYRYNLNTRKLKRLTSGEGSKGDAHWIEGALPVSLKDKKKILWGTLKQSNHNP